LTALSLGDPSEIAGEDSPVPDKEEAEEDEEAVDEEVGEEDNAPEEASAENTTGDAAPDPSPSPRGPRLLAASPAPPGWLR
jgi:hypothetical protein